MKLLSEFLDNTVKGVEVLDESNKNQKRMYIEGIFMQANVVNRNKRIYPRHVLANEANRYIRENVSKNRAFGELNHPDGPNINGDRIAIHIRSLTENGDNWIGKALVATTPQGEIVKGLLKDGANLGVSSRALGSLKPIRENVNEVQSDLRLLAIDVVTDPSAPEAWVNGIMEGADWVYNAATGIYEQKLGAIKSMSAQQIREHKVELFRSFLAQL